uniref:Uncharacterized protein n=1 Tax=Glossina austeni TaxID=7395 RepID=A0A1A9UNT6_GLOAU
MKPKFHQEEILIGAGGNNFNLLESLSDFCEDANTDAVSNLASSKFNRGSDNFQAASRCVRAISVALIFIQAQKTKSSKRPEWRFWERRGVVDSVVGPRLPPQIVRLYNSMTPAVLNAALNKRQFFAIVNYCLLIPAIVTVLRLMVTRYLYVRTSPSVKRLESIYECKVAADPDVGPSKLDIEIFKQYNIGNIYQKKLLMFETPIFYEAYKNAYNFLKTSDDRNFPFQKYIVFGEKICDMYFESHPPAYLDKKKIYDCDGIGLEPLAKQVPEKLFNLNEPQRNS